MVENHYPVHTLGKEIYIQDIMVKGIKDSYIYIPMRGHNYSLAVFENNKNIGWIHVNELGYNTVRDWVKSNPGWWLPE